MLDAYSDESRITMRRNKWIGVSGENGLPITDVSKNIRVIPREHWDGFKKWCATHGVTVNMKKREIDQKKTWWPCVIEITVEGDDNEYWVWAKLVET